MSTKDDQRAAREVTKRYLDKRGRIRYSVHHRDDAGLHVYVKPMRGNTVVHVLDGEEVATYKLAPKSYNTNFLLRLADHFKNPVNRIGRWDFSNPEEAARFLADHPSLVLADDVDTKGYIYMERLTPVGGHASLGTMYDRDVPAYYDREGVRIPEGA